MNAYEQRLIELALEEHFDGAQAPNIDITGSLRWSLERSRRQQENLALVPARQGSRRARWLAAGFLAGAVAAALVTVSVSGFNTQGNPRPAPITVELTRGSLAWTADTGVSRGLPSGPGSMPIAPGTRLRSGADGAVVRLASLGELELEGVTELEVESVKWRRSAGGAAIGGVEFLVHLGSGRFRGEGPTTEAQAGQSLRLGPAATDPAADGDELEELRQRLRRLQEANERLRVGARRNLVPTTPTERPQPGEAPPGKRERRRARLRYAKMNELLDQVDWVRAGAAFRATMSYIGARVSELENLPDVPLRLKAEFARLQSVMLLELSKVMKSEDGNRFTHPMIAANLLDGVLESAGMPIDARQRQRLSEIAVYYATADERLLGGAGAKTPALARLLDQHTLRDRFFSETRALLSPEQYNQLSHLETRGLTGLDAFSANAVVSGVTLGVVFSDQAELSRLMLGHFNRVLGLDPTQRDAMSKALNTWIGGFGATELGPQNSALIQFGALPATRVRAQARSQLRFCEQLQQRLSLRPRQQRALLDFGYVLLPIRR